MRLGLLRLLRLLRLLGRRSRRGGRRRRWHRRLWRLSSRRQRKRLITGRLRLSWLIVPLDDRQRPGLCTRVIVLRGTPYTPLAHRQGRYPIDQFPI